MDIRRSTVIGMCRDMPIDVFDDKSLFLCRDMSVDASGHVPRPVRTCVQPCKDMCAYRRVGTIV